MTEDSINEIRRVTRRCANYNRDEIKEELIELFSFLSECESIPRDELDINYIIQYLLEYNKNFGRSDLINFAMVTYSNYCLSLIKNRLNINGLFNDPCKYKNKNSEFNKEMKKIENMKVEY